MEEQRTNIPMLIKELRIRKSMKQTDLAEKSGLSLCTIRWLEQNKVKLSLYSAIKLEQALELENGTLTKYLKF